MMNFRSQTKGRGQLRKRSAEPRSKMTAALDHMRGRGVVKRG